MSNVVIERTADAVVVRSSHWVIEHGLAHGGAIRSIRFPQGSGENLLTAPFSSFIRFHRNEPGAEYGVYPIFAEANDQAPNIRIEQTADGYPVVIAEGVYKDDQGASIPVGYRRSTEYREYGLLWSTLEIMSDDGCDGVVHVRAFDAAFRPGLTHLFARPHPIVLNSSDLTGAGAWRDLATDATEATTTPFTSCYAPLQLIFFEAGVEGIELFPASELADWDLGLKPDMGLGLYQVHHGSKATQVELDPYCMAFRRRTIRLQGKYHFRLGIALPAVKPARAVHTGMFHASANSQWASDAELARLARAGVKLIRFHNDYREDDPYWHDGMYPPFDEAGMRELRRIIDTAHRHGMKIVPYVSLKEFHPEAPGYAENHRAWMHMSAPSVDVIHTFIQSGEFGGLMCLRSGWLDFRKRSVDTILSDLPWDGLYFDWCVPHPCRHPEHARGPFHNDVDEFLDFMLFCRKRVGPDGIIFTHLSGVPSIIAENMSDLVFIHEDIGHIVPLPGKFPTQCAFIPIAPRQLVASAPAGSPNAARFTIGGILDGYPAATHVPARDFSLQMLREMELFHDANLPPLKFFSAGDRAVKTGQASVYAAAWAGPDKLLLYAGNLSAKKAAGRLRFPQIKSLFAANSAFHIERRDPARPSGPRSRRSSPMKITNTGKLRSADLARRGIPYALPPLTSCLFVLTTT